MTKGNAEIKRTILWAVDPFAKDKKVQRSAAWAIKAMTNKVSAIVQPVYLHMGNKLLVPIPYPAELDVKITSDAQIKFGEMLSRIKIPNLKPLHAILDPFMAQREGADLLVQFAKKINAEFIVASTDANKGIKRFFLGSFVETLMLRSSVPVIVINPSWNRQVDFNHIIFATDFSSESREAFDRILEFSKKSGSRITLFNKIAFQYPYPGIELAFAAPHFDQVTLEEAEAKKKHAAHWIEDAEAIGVHVTSVVDQKRTGSASEAILKFAKKKSGIIAMASHSGPLASIFLGSTAREIVRQSCSPVWIIHPAAKKEISASNVTPLIRKRNSFSITEGEVMEDLVNHRRKA